MPDINTYFSSRRNQFHSNTIQRLYRSNPFRSLVKMGEFPMEEGQTPTIVSFTHELPTSYPSALSAVPVSSGTGNPACDPTATVIKRGQTERTFSLTATAFKTDTFCVSDIKRAWQAAKVVGALEKSLREYSTVFWSDWYRVQNIKMVDFKGATMGSSVYEEVESTAGTHVDLTNLPDAHLNWDHLRQIYYDLVRRGIADEWAVGLANGKPVIPLIAGPGIIERLYKDDSVIKEQIKYFDPKSNLSVMGYSHAIHGFVPVVDLFPIRYGSATLGAGNNEQITDPAQLVFANTIYPTVNANATVGRKYSLNSNYATVARGGLAQYEVATILPGGVYESLYEPSGPNAFAGMASFKPQDYSGEFWFVNQPTFNGDNDRGNLGYYLADIRVGAKPLNPDLGKSILTLATDI